MLGGERLSRSEVAKVWNICSSRPALVIFEFEALSLRIFDPHHNFTDGDDLRSCEHHLASKLRFQAQGLA